MQSVSSRIWTRIVVSNSYDDNNYTTGTSKHRYHEKVWCIYPSQMIQNFINALTLKTPLLQQIMTYLSVSNDSELFQYIDS